MPAALSSAYVAPILLLIGSNVFMTLAWYGHLRFKEAPLVTVIFVAWGIAFIEYCMAVPANRFGSAVYTTAQLKTIQEVITLIVFAGFSVLYLKEPITWNYAIGFVLIAAGSFFVFRGPVVDRDSCAVSLICQSIHEVILDLSCHRPSLDMTLGHPFAWVRWARGEAWHLIPNHKPRSRCTGSDWGRAPDRSRRWHPIRAAR